MPRGGFLGLAIGGGAVALGAIVAGVFVVRGLTGGDAGPGPRVASQGAQIATEGMSAPGTAELRALGCEQALVVDMQRLLGGVERIRPGEPRYMVTCDMIQAAGAPTCERVAAAYFTALGGVADADVCARVIVVGSNKPSCSRLFAPNGADLGVFPHAE